MSWPERTFFKSHKNATFCRRGSAKALSAEKLQRLHLSKSGQSRAPSLRSVERMFGRVFLAVLIRLFFRC